MTQEVMEMLQEKLARKLRLAEPDEDVMTLLEDELLDAEAEILLELNVDKLEEELYSKAVELAAVYFRYDIAQEGAASEWSYAEGELKDSEKRFSPLEYQRTVREILDSLSRYRRVTC
jgi:hypothetical protein